MGGQCQYPGKGICEEKHVHSMKFWYLKDGCKPYDSDATNAYQGDQHRCNGTAHSSEGAHHNVHGSAQCISHGNDLQPLHAGVNDRVAGRVNTQ